jgi:hypothetical protein
MKVFLSDIEGFGGDFTFVIYKAFGGDFIFVIYKAFGGGLQCSK